MIELNAMHSEAINGPVTFWVSIYGEPTTSGVPNNSMNALYSGRDIVF